MGLLNWALFVGVLAIGGPLLMSYVFRGWVAKYDSPKYSFDDIPDLTGKIALVTGSNTGIGYVTSRELAKKGAHVIATARSVSRGEKAVNEIKEVLSSSNTTGSIEFMQLDLASFKSIEHFSTEVTKKINKVDFVIFNAGVMMPPYGTTEDGFETQIGTNHLGHFFLFKELEQLIVGSKSRVVVVSSAAHEFTFDGIRFDSFDNDKGYDPVTAYSQSKLANVLFSNALSRKYHAQGVTSNSLHPGAIKTELIRHVDNFFKNDAILKFVAPLMSVVDLTMMDADMGAMTQLFVATSPKVSEVTGQYFEPIAKLKKPSSFALDVTLQDKLWDYSELLYNKLKEANNSNKK